MRKLLIPALIMSLAVLLPTVEAQKKTKADAISDPQEPLVITMDAAGKIFLQETEVDVDGLVAKLQAITQNKTDTRIFVRADRDIAYGKVMVVMGSVTSAGFTQVALITDTAVSAKPGTKPPNGQ